MPAGALSGMSFEQLGHRWLVIFDPEAPVSSLSSFNRFAPIGYRKNVPSELKRRQRVFLTEKERTKSRIFTPSSAGCGNHLLCQLCHTLASAFSEFVWIDAADVPRLKMITLAMT